MQPGDIIADEYRLDRQLGSGAFGTVWRATQLSVGRPCAIKFLKEPKGSSLQRFEREARALASISHPNCVAVHDSGTTAAGDRYLVMELAEGEPLAASRGEHRRVDEVVEIVRQLAAALAAAHAAGVAHRDLKPENIVVSKNPDGLSLKVLDFGLAKLYGLDQIDVTETGEVFGTPQYMSPEQLRGTRDAGPPSDIYALGVITFELLEGRLPFDGPTMLELAMAHLSQPVPRLDADDMPPRLPPLVHTMLDKQASTRPTAARILSELEQLHDPIESHSPPPLPPAVGRSGLGLVLIVAVVVLCGVLIWGFGPIATVDELPPESVQGSRKLDGLVRGGPAADMRTSPTLPDASLEQAKTTTQTGCGNDWEVGVDVVSVGSFLAPREVVVYIPASYDANRVHPYVLLFHRRPLVPGHFGRQFLERLSIEDYADEHGLVVIAPYSPDSWEDIATETGHALDVLEWADRHLCLDHNRRFALGYATGGDFVRSLRCEVEFAGVGTISSAENVGEDVCESRPTPYIRFSGARDLHVPRAGGRGCSVSGATRLSATEIDAAWRSRNLTSGDGEGWRVRDDGRCTLWSGPAPYASCVLDGGRYIPGDEKGAELPSCLDSQISNTFPVGEVALQFFDEYGLTVDR